MRLWHLSPSVNSVSNTHAQQSTVVIRLIFGQTLRLLPYFMCANSEGSGERCAVSPEPSLLAYAISTIISWAGSNIVSQQYCQWMEFGKMKNIIRTASSEFGLYRLCEQRRFRRACASAQSRQNLRCSLKQAVSQEEPSNRKPDPWPLSMTGHAQLKCVMTECSKTQIRLTRLILYRTC